MFKKVFMREASYTLDYIAQKHLGEATIGEFDFNKLSPEIARKNKQDVDRMVKLESKYKLIDYFDEIRLLTKTMWEDLYFNSFIIEMLLFEEAKLKNVILPNVPNRESRDEDEETTFEGATRECIETGTLFGVGKFDLSSAYPNMIINFCLDPQNIVQAKNEATIEIDGVFWEQSDGALLPDLVKKLITLKDNLKKERDKHPQDSEEFKKLSIKYDAIKAVVNSAFGVMGFQGFRVYNNNVASAIAFLVRDLLMYVKDNIEKQGFKVVYWDTDSVFCLTTDNISDSLNELVRRWAKEKYGKDDISIEFDYEGYFEKLFLLTKCRYYGLLKSKKGTKEEIKGMEMKRASSSKYEGTFQKELISKLLDKGTKEEILKWIRDEKKRIKTLPLEHIAFPCKLQNKKYKNLPIFIRAYNNSKELKGDFVVNKGEIFYYTYIKSNNPSKNALAFTVQDKEMLKNERIDYDEIIRRNIDSKARNIFVAMKWDERELDGQFQSRIF